MRKAQNEKTSINLLFDNEAVPQRLFSIDDISVHPPGGISFKLHIP